MSLTLENTSPCLIDRPLTINNDAVKVDEYGGSIRDGVGNGIEIRIEIRIEIGVGLELGLELGIFAVFLHAGRLACAGC